MWLTSSRSISKLFQIPSLISIVDCLVKTQGKEILFDLFLFIYLFFGQTAVFQFKNNLSK